MTTLEPGLSATLTIAVEPHHIPARLLPESPEFQLIAPVLATGYLVAMLEWSCQRLIAEHLEPGQGSVGTGIAVTHEAATPPNTSIEVEATLIEVDGRRLRFEVVAKDDLAVISRGTHERALIDRQRFQTRLDERLAARS